MFDRPLRARNCDDRNLLLRCKSYDTKRSRWKICHVQSLQIWLTLSGMVPEVHLARKLRSFAYYPPPSTLQCHGMRTTSPRKVRKRIFTFCMIVTCLVLAFCWIQQAIV